MGSGVPFSRSCAEQHTLVKNAVISCSSSAYSLSQRMSVPTSNTFIVALRVAAHFSVRWSARGIHGAYAEKNRDVNPDPLLGRPQGTCQERTTSHACRNGCQRKGNRNHAAAVKRLGKGQSTMVRVGCTTTTRHKCQGTGNSYRFHEPCENFGVRGWATNPQSKTTRRGAKD